MCPDYLRSECDEGAAGLPARLDPYGEQKAIHGFVRLLRNQVLILNLRAQQHIT